MRFVILGDLHYSDYSQPEHSAARDRLFRAFFQQVAAVKADAVFAIGDTANRGTFSELAGLEALAKEADLPFIRVTGNHDIYGLEKHELAQYFLGGYPAASATELYTRFDMEDTRFILLDSARVKMSNTDWSGFVSDEQLAWLETEIQHYNADDSVKHLMVMAHHPLFGTTRRSDENMLNIANSEAVYRAFGLLRRTPGFYFCGHNHSHSIFGPDAQNWYHIQTGDPLDCRSFRLITVSTDRVETEIIDFDLSDPALYADFETARTSIESGFGPKEFEASYGEAADHRLAVAL